MEERRRINQPNLFNQRNPIQRKAARMLRLQREMIHLDEQQAQGVTFPPGCKVYICSHGNGKEHIPIITSSGIIKSVMLQLKKRGSFTTLYNVSMQDTGVENREVIIEEKDLRFQNGAHVLFKNKKDGEMREEKKATVLGMYDRPLSTLLEKDDESTFWYVLETEEDGCIHNKVDERDVDYWNGDLILQPQGIASNSSVPVHIADDCKDETDPIICVSPNNNANASSQVDQQNDGTNFRPNYIRDQSVSFNEKQRSLDFMDQVPHLKQREMPQLPLYGNDDDIVTSKVIRDKQPSVGDDLKGNFKLTTGTEEDEKAAMTRSRSRSEEEKGRRRGQTRRDSQGMKRENYHRNESNKMPSHDRNYYYEYTYQLRLTMLKGEMDEFFKTRCSSNHISVSRFKCSCYPRYHPDGSSMLEFKARRRKDVVDSIDYVRQKLQERAKNGKERFVFKVTGESVKRQSRRKDMGGHHGDARLIERKRNCTEMESSCCDDDYHNEASHRYSRYNDNLRSCNHYEKRYRCEDVRCKNESGLQKSESIISVPLQVDKVQDFLHPCGFYAEKTGCLVKISPELDVSSCAVSIIGENKSMKEKAITFIIKDFECNGMPENVLESLNVRHLN